MINITISNKIVAINNVKYLPYLYAQQRGDIVTVSSYQGTQGIFSSHYQNITLQDKSYNSAEQLISDFNELQVSQPAYNASKTFDNGASTYDDQWFTIYNTNLEDDKGHFTRIEAQLTATNTSAEVHNQTLCIEAVLFKYSGSTLELPSVPTIEGDSVVHEVRVAGHTNGDVYIQVRLIDGYTKVEIATNIVANKQSSDISIANLSNQYAKSAIDVSDSIAYINRLRSDSGTSTFAELTDVTKSDDPHADDTSRLATTKATNSLATSIAPRIYGEKKYSYITSDDIWVTVAELSPYEAIVTKLKIVVRGVFNYNYDAHEIQIEVSHDPYASDTVPIINILSNSYRKSPGKIVLKNLRVAKQDSYISAKTRIQIRKVGKFKPSDSSNAPIPFTDNGVSYTGKEYCVEVQAISGDLNSAVVPYVDTDVENNVGGTWNTTDKPSIDTEGVSIIGLGTSILKLKGEVNENGGKVSDTGIDSFTCSRDSQGYYVMTHNLATLDYEAKVFTGTNQAGESPETAQIARHLNTFAVYMTKNNQPFNSSFSFEIYTKK